MKTKTINRETSDSYKGFPYQKKKTAHRILELFNTENSFLVIPEYIDDIFVQVDEKQELTQVKKSDSKNFTLNSKDVYKSIVCFLDAYFKHQKGSTLSFCLYTNTSITKEKSENFKEIEEPVLNILKKTEVKDKIITIVKSEIIKRYEEIYKKNQDVEDGYINEIKDMSVKEWKEFFKRIDFAFQSKNDEELFDSSLKLIKESKEYSRAHFEREEDILNELLTIIDDKMASKSLFDRIIRKVDVDLIFEKKKNFKSNKLNDSNCFQHDEWKQIESEKDKKRNIEEKIKDVCQKIDSRLLKKYKLKASTAVADLNKLTQNEQLVFKQRVYMFMLDFACENITETKNYSSLEIKEIIKNWQEYCVDRMNDLKRDFYYTYNNDEFIRTLVLLMIDQCYHKFEVEEIA